MIRLKQALSNQKIEQKALEEYKEVINNIVGKYNQNTMNKLCRSNSVCPRVVSSYQSVPKVKEAPGQTKLIIKKIKYPVKTMEEKAPIGRQANNDYWKMKDRYAQTS